MATVNWKERAHRETGAIINENFGNPALPEMIWIRGYLAGTLETTEEFRETTAEVLNDIRNYALSSSDTPTDEGDEAA